MNSSKKNILHEDKTRDSSLDFSMTNFEIFSKLDFMFKSAFWQIKSSINNNWKKPIFYLQRAFKE
jgi:hypothetical protein